MLTATVDRTDHAELPETDVNLRAQRVITVDYPQFRDSLVHKWHRLASKWWKWVLR
jgi:hypothetical protein